MLARNLREEPKCLPGAIVNRTGPVAYEVNINGQLWKRHAEQLLSSSSAYASMPDEPLSEPEDRTSMGVEVPVEVDSEVAAMSIPENTSRSWS